VRPVCFHKGELAVAAVGVRKRVQLPRPHPHRRVRMRPQVWHHRRVLALRALRVTLRGAACRGRKRRCGV
jgi:hypothetical protein